MKERRAFVRVRPDASQPIRIEVVGNGFIELLKARDISVGGLGVQISHDLEIPARDREVELVVTLPGSKAFVAFGEIRHQMTSPGSHSFGIRFTRLSDADKKRIQEYVERRVAEGGGI